MGVTRTRIHLRRLLALVGVACVVTPAFNLLTSGASLHQALQGLVDAVLITLLVGGYLLFVREGLARRHLRRLGFWSELGLSSTIVLVLFLVGRALGQVLTTLDPQRFVSSFGERHLIVALPFFALLAVSVQFILQMNRLIGTNALRYFMAGAYRRPLTEERIFLFIDLEGSTGLAEALGSERYFELLRRFIDELSEPLLETEGEIYQYAGDEVVITWPAARGVRDANCVRCFFALRDAVARAAARYRRDFDAVPRFRAGLHGGAVTAGELGDLRQQIVFVGDILNTAARLEEFAKRSGFGLVVSGELLRRLQLPQGIEAAPCGELPLRGKRTPVAAFSLSRP